nr:glycosyltransferase family 1 protein [Prevotella sp.]
MNIGFDAKRAAQNRTGLGNYSRFVIRILSEKFAGNQYHLYTPKPHRMPYLQEIPTLKHLFLHFPPQGIWSRIRSLWRVWGITKDIQKDGIQIFHGLSNELPLNIGTPEQRKMKAGGKGCKYIVTLHDLIFIHTPQYYHWIDRQIYNFKFRRACRCADRVIAVSEYTKQEIMHYYHTPESKIDVVYQGCDPVFSQEIEEGKLQEVKTRYQLPDKFVLYVGSIEERKNLMLVAKAMAELNRRAAIHVVAVGRRTAYVDQIQDFLKAQGIDHLFHFYHQVPYADLPSFYKWASTFAYPSRIEGFGIPLLEAISSGVPAIGCTGSCLEEAGGPNSIYVNPDDAKGMADAILRTCTDEPLRQHMISEGKKYALNFSDEKLSHDLMKVYESLSE